jgi:2-keto-3-deoxy-L-rhamnonate aldolase RhmA
MAHLPAATLDGAAVEVCGNLQLVDEIPAIMSYGGDGVGLYRTEMAYLSRRTLPCEEDLFGSYRRVAEAAAPRPVTIRTLDLGADKIPRSLESAFSSENQALGLRAIRFCLKHPEVFRTQLRAILRASVYGNLRIMIPMVSSAAHAKSIVRYAKYPPRGVRGLVASAAKNGYRQTPPMEAMRQGDENTLIICQIETAEGLENVEEIAAVEGVDVIWVGHYDLTVSMGFPGDFTNPRYHDAIKRVVSTAQKYNKPAGFLAMNEAAARDYWAKGFRMMGYGSDFRLLQSAVSLGMSLLRSLDV